MELIAGAARGAAAVGVLALAAGGVPRLVALGIAVLVGLWSATVAPVLMLPDGGAAWLVVARELAIGAAIGIAAAVPVVAAATAGRLVDVVNHPRATPYRALFGVLAAAVFVGIDGHVAVVTAVLDSRATLPVGAGPGVVDALAAIVPAAVRLAIPWLVTAAVVELAVGAGMRLAARAGTHVPTAAAVPAALVMMTAALVGTLAVAIAALVRGAL